MQYIFIKLNRINWQSFTLIFFFVHLRYCLSYKLSISMSKSMISFIMNITRHFVCFPIYNNIYFHFLWIFTILCVQWRWFKDECGMCLRNLVHDWQHDQTLKMIIFHHHRHLLLLIHSQQSVHVLLVLIR